MPNASARAGMTVITVGRILALLGAALAAFTLSGCGTPAGNAALLANSEFESTGWPFRWKAREVSGGSILSLTLMDLPSGPTQADAILKKDTLALLTKAEASAGRPAPKVEDIKHLKDGREVWVLHSSDSGIAYVSTFTPSPQGGVDISLRGPQLYSRETGNNP